MVLRVGLEKCQIADPCRVAPPVFEKRLAAIDAQHRARGAGQSCQFYRRVPETAADIDDPVAFLYAERRQDPGAVKRHPAYDDMLEAHEFGDENIVPEVD